MRVRTRITLAAVLMAFALLPAQAQKTVPDQVNGGVFNSVAPALQNNQTAPFQLDSAGKLLTNTVVTIGSVSVGVTPGTAASTNPLSSPIMAEAVSPGSPLYAAGNLQIVTQTTGGSLNVNITGGAATTNTPTSGGSTPFAGVVPVSPGYVPTQAFNYALNTSTGKYDALNLDGSENLKVAGGVTAGTAHGTSPLGSPVLAEVVTAGTYPVYSADQVQMPSITPRGEAYVATGLNPLMVSVAGGVTGGTAQAAATSGVGGIPMLAATVSAGYGSGGGNPLTQAQLNIPTLTTSGALRVSPVAEAVGGADGHFHLNGGTANSTNSTLVAVGPRTLYNLTTLATTTTAGFLRIYDSATAPTCSSATGVKDSFPVPVPSAVPGAAGYTISFGPIGWAFSNGIAFCFTANGTDTDNTAAGNTGTYISATYK